MVKVVFKIKVGLTKQKLPRSSIYQVVAWRTDRYQCNSLNIVPAESTNIHAKVQQ